MAKSNDTSNVAVKATESALIERKSTLEDAYEVFPAELVQQSRKASPNTALLMGRLNRVHQLCAGMGAVMRIVSGNPVMEQDFDANDFSSEPPLSDYAISNLTNMVAAICETIVDEISACAQTFEDKVSA